ncbi:Clavaminate synthase-like protein [Exidia glandulosa HHB12029]|uniref:Clavaminate synthase-like protein n=1 Tax=Exidia glandulosa HHB12029 TaxID=1314781 RepID=A0A165HKT4_EXIGL|nr:Clavaminate synthase-like protein [Exidia glandulosa HHB12029]
MGFDAIVAQPVAISYRDLVDAPETLQPQIARAFGSEADCLGLIIVKDLPETYAGLRERLLKIAYEFASLSDEEKEKCVDSRSRYSFGWSHGKEIMNGQPDTLKGSYYANPVVDEPDVSSELREQFLEYHSRNVWPEKTGLEQAFKELGSFIFNVGILLAKACQPFVDARLKDSSVSLPDMIAKSQTTKGRLLHYYPPPENMEQSEALDSWCGMHLDHSVLTGLCSAMYLSEGKPPQVVPSPSPASGLYIKTRGGVLAKANIPVDALAFQTGEALEIATDGRLRATPHFVHVGYGGEKASKTSRETFALFMQPNVTQVLSKSDSGVVTFGDFSKRVFDEHYEPQM